MSSGQLPPELISAIFEFAVWSDPYIPVQVLRGSNGGSLTLWEAEQQRSNLEASGGFWVPEYDPQMRVSIGLVSKVCIYNRPSV